MSTWGQGWLWESAFRGQGGRPKENTGLHPSRLELGRKNNTVATASQQTARLDLTDPCVHLPLVLPLCPSANVVHTAPCARWSFTEQPFIKCRLHARPYTRHEGREWERRVRDPHLLSTHCCGAWYHSEAPAPQPARCKHQLHHLLPWGLQPAPRCPEPQFPPSALTSSSLKGCCENLMEHI